MITAAKPEIMRPGRFVCHSFILSLCVLDYCNSNRPISSKLDVVIGRTNRKNPLTFRDDPVPDTDFESLFHFPHHCGIGDFGRVISISHTVTGKFSRQSAKWLTDTDKVMNPQHVGSHPADIRVRIGLI